MLANNVREVTLVQASEILDPSYVPNIPLIVTKKELNNVYPALEAISVSLCSKLLFLAHSDNSLLMEFVRNVLLE